MGNYDDHRELTNKSLNFDSVFKTIKIFLKKNSTDDNPTINFSGGEPLLKWNLIKKIITTTVNEFPSKKVQWFINTNGMLLTEDKFDFLKKEKIMIRVSLDGPKEIHDRNRIDINSNGTFDKIISNLNKFKIKYPNFYRKNVSISLVIMNPEYISEVHNFFLENAVVKNIPKLCSQVNNLKLKNKEIFHPLKIEDFNKEMEEYIEFIQQNNSHKFPFNFWWAKYLLTLNSRDISPLKSTSKMLNMCVPGSHRLVLHPDGNFGFCIQGAESYRIGSLENGLNYKKVYKLIRKIENFLSSHCRNCWAFRICPICVGFFMNDSKFSKNLFLKSCSEIKTHLESVFILYLKINNLNPNLIDHIYSSV